MLDFVEFQKFKNFKSQKINFKLGVSLVAGGNNSGKTSLFQGLAVWEFCRTLVEAEKGRLALTPGQNFQGIGISEREFLPINLPSLSHLWTNLRPQKANSDSNGYTLRIRCGWNGAVAPKFLEFGLALANDRLFVKTTGSNLSLGDKIPRIAYLPPFAGISPREERLPRALRQRKIGEGLAGSVIRNSLLDMHLSNLSARKALRGTKSKLPDTDLKKIRSTDPWEIVQRSLREVFSAELEVSPFNEEYHSYIEVKVVKGSPSAYKLVRYPNFNARDLMVEGSGFLQWLSVFSLVTDPNVDVLLLDEPDAHLHPTLQRELFDRVSLASEKKTVLVATHSPEVLRWADFQTILAFDRKKPPAYLPSQDGKVGLIAGIGSSYLPKLDAARESKKVFFVEGDGDGAVLQKAASILGKAWSSDWVIWPEKNGHSERIRLAKMLAQEIPGLKVVSLRDRDLTSSNAIGLNLVHSGISHDQLCTPLSWKRRNIESYLIWPAAIAAAAGLSEADVLAKLTAKFGISVPPDFKIHNVPPALLDIDGKEVLSAFGLKWINIIDHMDLAWLPDDFLMVLGHLGM